jgi:hypothetical protein
MKILMKNEHTGEVRECSTGFSWAGLLTSIIVVFWRGDTRWGVLGLVIILLTLPTGLPVGLGVNAVVALMYNDFHISRLYKKGFRPVNYQDNLYIDNVLKKYNIAKI